MLVWACIAPHGSEFIPELGFANRERMACTGLAMAELGRRCRLAKPDTIVVYTPHWVCVDDHYAISIMSNAVGRLEGEAGDQIAASFVVDRELALSIANRAVARGVPVAGVAEEDDGSPTPVVELDWGAFIPLWYMGARWRKKPQIVVACPSRSLSRQQLVAFGEATADAARHSDRRIALICSADQGHGHDADGRYGFSPLSGEYDAAYCAALEQNDLARMLEWDQDWIEGALTDSFWQTLSLHGALLSKPMRCELLSYEAPTYFGMACAAFEPNSP